MYIIYNYKSRSTNSFLFPPSCKVKSIKCPLSYFPTFLLFYAPTGFFRCVATKKILNYRVSRHFFVILHSNTLKQR